MAVGSFRVPAGGGASTEDWVRPSDWLAMPTVTDVEQKFVGLHAIFPEGNNFAALLFTTSTGQYQVDWGDGSSPTLHNSNTKAEYAYDYATYDTGNTTLSSRGYKQAIITVTPVSGNLLTCNFQQRYTGQNQAYATGFLDCIISMPNHSASAFTFGGTTVRHAYVERFDVKTLGSCNSLASMFSACSSLQSVPLFNTAAVTSMTSMFSACSSLQSVPLFNTAAVTSMASMFVNCLSLQSVPLFNTAAVTNMAQMFSGCSSLQSVPLFNTAAVTNMNATFNNCSSLQSVPLFNTALVTNMSTLFSACSSLQSVPLFNTAAVTNMTFMFNNCFSLQSIPALSTAGITISSGTDFDVIAFSCNSLDRCQMAFARFVGFSNCQLSATAITEILTNLAPRTSTSATIILTGNWGLGTIISRSFTITDGSTTITTGDTSSLVAGMQVTGTGSPLSSPVAVTFQDTGDTVTLVAHGLENDDEVSFAAITSTTGLALNTIYYIVNKTTDTFQVASTIGGSPLPLTTNGSGTMRHRTEIVSIVANTSITMSRPMRGSGSQTLAFRTLKTGTALLKNWAVTG
jgi:surface protein